MQVMSEFEIARVYNNLPDNRARKIQLEALAQVNETTVTRIVEIADGYNRRRSEKDREYARLLKIHRKNNKGIINNKGKRRA